MKHLIEYFFSYEKPRVKCTKGGQCDLTRMKVSNGISSEQYRWKCNKCGQHYFYSDSFLNGKKIV